MKVPVCYICNRIEHMPFKCRKCGKSFCIDHRLPENHNCKYDINIIKYCHYCGIDLNSDLKFINKSYHTITQTGGLYELHHTESKESKFLCNRCNKHFCSKHRLPENHNCSN